MPAATIVCTTALGHRQLDALFLGSTFGGRTSLPAVGNLAYSIGPRDWRAVEVEGGDPRRLRRVVPTWQQGESLRHLDLHSPQLTTLLCLWADQAPGRQPEDVAFDTTGWSVVLNLTMWLTRLAPTVVDNHTDGGVWELVDGTWAYSGELRSRPRPSYVQRRWNR